MVEYFRPMPGIFLIIKTLVMQPAKNALKNLLAVLPVIILCSCQKNISDLSAAKSTPASPSAAAVVTHSIIDLDLTENPFPFPIIVPCANGGAGEEIVPQGNVRQLSHVTINGKSYSVKFQYTPQGVFSIGKITGDIYQATGVSEFTETGSFVNGRAVITSVWMFTNIGRAGAPNWKIIPTVHTTLNADGTLTASIDKLVASCE
jgi:hypothetical protein